MRDEGRLQAFTLAMKRIVNILPKEYRRSVTREEGDAALAEFSGSDGADRSFDTDLFVEASESTLFDAASSITSGLLALGSSELDNSVEILSGLVPAVNSYFDEVLVNCEDESARKNRIAFLLALSRLSGRFCDFSGIVSDQGQ